VEGHKEKVFPVLNQAPFQDVLGSEGIAPLSLTSAVGRGEWSASRPGRFTSGDRAPGAHWIGGWVELTTGVDAVEKPGRPARSSSLYRLSYPEMGYFC
jgi:hypothetical protein